MRLNGKKFEEVFDEAVSRIASDAPEPARAEEAAQRVWKNIMAEMKSAEPADLGGRISGCADVQALLPAYSAHKLTAARELLVQDHLKECVACRNELHSPGTRKSVILPWRNAVAEKKAGSGFQTRKFAIAAAMVVGVALGAYALRDQFTTAPQGMRASLQSADGPVYLVNASTQRLAKPGEEFAEKDWVRVPQGSHAFVKLRDGSVVEMNQQSEMTVSMTRKDTSVRLERGAIIVQAAKRRTGHLLVLTNDSTVSVTGTVFSVNSGTKGNRVSVVEGEVVVEGRGRTSVLHSGDMVTSNSNMERVSVRDEIGWSRNLDQHVALLKEFAGLAKQIQEIKLPGLRYESKLLPLLPENTALFVSIPNMGDALNQANRLLQDRVRQSAVLRDWWQKSGGDKQESINQMVDTIKQLSDYLGDEIVLAVTKADMKSKPEFVVLAEVKKPGLREFMDSKMKEMGVKDLPKEMSISAGQRLFSISANRELAAQLEAGAQTRFASSDFGKRIAETYTDGAGIVFAANMAALRPSNAVAAKVGASDMQYVVLERREIRNQTENKATVNFSGPRHGVASWLAAPAPLGSLKFVSSGAMVAAGFVVKSPTLVADDIFALLETAHPDFRKSVEAFETRTGVRVRDDIAASLGTDVTVSIDGQMLPLPAWKIVAEVTDPVRLQQSFDRLLQEYQKMTQAENGEKGIVFETTEMEGHKVYLVKGVEHPFELRYAFSDGYLIMTQDAGAMRRAFRAKDDNRSLLTSNRFQRLLPTDREPNFSAVVFYNLGDAAKGLADLAGQANLSDSQRRNVDELLRSVEPALIYAYGSEDKVQLATTSGFFGLTIEQILGSAGISDVVRMAQTGTKKR